MVVDCFTFLLSSFLFGSIIDETNVVLPKIVNKTNAIKNVLNLEHKNTTICPKSTVVDFNEEDDSFSGRSFGGQEPINITLVNISILGPMGWLSMSSRSVLDVIFHISGYTILGKNAIGSVRYLLTA
jgi:hypothetical protein